ncbi:MAG: hypothetical protein AAF772_16735 [Acidobacteriota bacterium]
MRTIVILSLLACLVSSPALASSTDSADRQGALFGAWRVHLVDWLVQRFEPLTTAVQINKTQPDPGTVFIIAEGSEGRTTAAPKQVVPRRGTVFIIAEG